MYIVDGIAYAGEPSRPLAVTGVRPLPGFRLWLRFNNDETRVFDFRPLLEYPCYAPLRDETVFNSVYVDYGSAVWNDGTIDAAPEHLYENGIPQ